jgi:hypothetical protein
MIYVFIAVLIGTSVAVSLAIDSFSEKFVHKMDDLLLKLTEVSDSLSGIYEEMYELSGHFIQLEKTAIISDEALEILKRQAARDPSKSITKDGLSFYEEGLKDGAAELAKSILEHIKEPVNG